MTVYLTKYALTKGIETADGVVTETPTMLQAGGCFYHGDDWHDTREAAVARVRVMIAAKRKTIEKTLAKLTALGASLDEKTERRP